MADEPTTQERTESPTPRRRQQAREEGRVARSQELSAAAVLLAGTAALAGFGGQSLAGFAIRLMRESARSLSSGPLTAGGAVMALRSLATGLVLALLPFLLVVGGLVALVNLVQARGVASWKPVAPKLSHVSPVAGLKRLFSLDAAFALLKSSAKVAALAVVVYVLLGRSWPELMSLANAGPLEVGAVLRTLVLKLAFVTGLAFLTIAVLDYGFQWFRMERSLRMTRQELVYEFRETEGDPMVKSRLRSIAMAQARKRMLQRVPTADVVVVNPTHIAVALKYDTEIAPAPVVVAMGERKLAERIRELALKANVPVVENRMVARALLATATVGQPIPPALYAAIAEILAFVYRQRGTLPGARALLAGGRAA